MEKSAAESDIAFIRQVLDRTQKRIDPHAFHFVWWGAIVLVWYPLGNLITLTGRPESWLLWLGVGSLVVGFLGSTVLEARLKKSSRLSGENTFIEKQVVRIVGGSLGAGFLLSGVAPATDFIPGHQIPTLWALVYSVMAYMVGVVYTRDFLWSGLVIFAAALTAMFLPDLNGLIVGPAMGIGMIVPGLRAERRVSRLRTEDRDRDAAGAGAPGNHGG